MPRTEASGSKWTFWSFDSSNALSLPQPAYEPNTCRPDCVEPTCGDGILDDDFPYNEECDDGSENSNDPDSCRSDCTAPFCGDGILDVLAGETCDDGNNVGGDGCSALCMSEVCGNGILNPGETCDDGNNNVNDACPDGPGGTCQPASCGDGYIWSQSGGTEECDDGNTDNGDGCSSVCMLE